MQNPTPRKPLSSSRKELRFYNGHQEQGHDLEYELYARDKEIEEFDQVLTNVVGKIREIHKEFVKYGLEEVQNKPINVLALTCYGLLGG